MENKVYYSDFGAKGDGVTNDFFAIKAAHEKANEIGAKVFGEAGKTYYISKTGGETITVKTSTDFCGAEVIIDDRSIMPNDAERRASIFVIASEYSQKEYGPDSSEVKALNEACPLDINTRKLPIAPGFDAMAILYNTDKKVYIRLGSNSNSGAGQHELTVIDKNGNIDVSTPLLLPYEKVTSLVLVRIDDEPITFENGIFTTRANAAPREYTYYSRNVLINRSNVTIKNLTHYVTDEGDTGAPYGPFISPGCANNLTLLDSSFTGHKTYWETSGNSPMGTYDLGGSNSNNILYKNCKQTNMFLDDGSYNHAAWGIMGSNYCKNITYEDCILSRFDAHQGVYNATIRNSTLATLRLTGGGNFLLENSTVHFGYGEGAISLREDYGCTWRGDITIKNVTFENVSGMDEEYIIRAVFYPHHNFGYQAYYPENITVDGFKLTRPARLYLFNDVTCGEGCDLTADRVTYKGEEIENVNKTILPKSITLKNISGATSFGISPDETLNSQLKIKD